MAAKIKEYDNGATLIYQNDKDAKDSSFSLCMKVGSQDEMESEYGVAHFLEHLFFKSTNRMSTEDISKYLENLGADINAYTTTEETQYFFRCLSENLEPCLKMYSEMFYDGKFDKKEVDKERLVVLEEIKRYNDFSISKSHRNGTSSLFAGTPLEHDILGTESVIKNISIKEIKDFKKRTYVPQRMFLSVRSSLPFKKIESMVKKYFQTESKRKEYSELLTPQELHLSPNKNRVLHIKPDNQVNLYVLTKTKGYLNNEERYAEVLFSRILGSGMSSRFFIELREKLGLAYAVNCSINHFQNCGALTFYIGTSPQNVKLALKKMKSILKDFAKNGATEDELIKVKAQQKSKLVFSESNKSTSVHVNATSFYRMRKIKSLDEKIKDYENITLEQVNNVAKRIFNEKAVVVSAVGQNIAEDDLKF